METAQTARRRSISAILSVVRQGCWSQPLRRLLVDLQIDSPPLRLWRAVLVGIFCRPLFSSLGKQLSYKSSLLIHMRLDPVLHQLISKPVPAFTYRSHSLK